MWKKLNELDAEGKKMIYNFFKNYSYVIFCTLMLHDIETTTWHYWVAGIGLIILVEWYKWDEKAWRENIERKRRFKEMKRRWLETYTYKGDGLR
jgi:hypothetical protein